MEGAAGEGAEGREYFIDGIASCTGHFTKCFSEVNSEKLCHTCWLHTVSHYNAATSCLLLLLLQLPRPCGEQEVERKRGTKSFITNFFGQTQLIG